MAEQAEQVSAALTIIPTPRSYQHEYTAYLTDVGNDRTVSAQFDLDLNELSRRFSGDDPEAYGTYLFDQIFRQSVKEGTDERGRLASRLGELLRQADNLNGGDLRLKVEVDATLLPILQSVAWEYLFYEGDGIALGADLRSSLFRDVAVDADRRSAIKGTPRVLVAVVSPDESSLKLFNRQFRMNLNPIDVATESQRLTLLFESLRPKLVYSVLPAGTSATGKLAQIVEAAHDGEFHILHLLCHGVVLNNKAHLLLADADGAVQLVDEESFAAELADLGRHLRLVVLDACQTAQFSQTDSFSGVVARLIRVVPAVIGMQRTWYTGVAGDKFTRNFYSELCKRGLVDKAVQRARNDLRRWKKDRWEWGTPVLYLRLGEGHLFHVKPRAESPDEEATTGAEPEEVHHGGTGVLFGPGTVLSDVTIEATAAGGSIFDGGLVPDDAPTGGTGMHFEGAHIEGSTIRGEFAGGGIYREALAKQALADYGLAERAAAQIALLSYYQAQLAALRDQVADATAADHARLAEEISDLQTEIEALQGDDPDDL